MASPEYKPIFKTNPSVVGGLASLLNGYNQGKRQGLENKTVLWKDPSRPIDPNELQRMIMENYQKGLVNQMGYAGFSGGAPTPQNFMSQIMALNAIRQGQTPNAGFDPMSGQPNPITPTMQVQGLPGPSMPSGGAQPAAPTMVSRSGVNAQMIVDEMRKRGLVK